MGFFEHKNKEILQHKASGELASLMLQFKLIITTSYKIVFFLNTCQLNY